MTWPVRFGFALLTVVVLVVVSIFLSVDPITDGHVGVLMLGLVVSAIMLGFPAAFTLIGMGVLFGLYAFDGNWDILQRLVVQRAWATITSDVLVAIPLFLFMGYVVERSNLIEKLFQTMHIAMARVPASLAVTTLLTCALFATATGIIGAVVALMGLLALPVLLKAGYSKQLSAGVVAAGGCLGILIPPSVLLILYGATAGVSVVQLYAGALFPGLLLAGLYIAYVVILALVRPSVAPRLTAEQRHVELPAFAQGRGTKGDSRALPALLKAINNRANTGIRRNQLALYLGVALFPLAAFLAIGALIGSTSSAELTRQTDGTFPGNAGNWVVICIGLAALGAFYLWLTVSRLEVIRLLVVAVIPLAALVGAVLGSIIFGLATPTEAAAMGSMGGLLLAFAYHRLNYPMLRDSLFLTAKTTAMVGWLILSASIFASVFALLGGQGLIEDWVLGMDLTPIQFLILAQVIIFVLGWPFDWTEIIVIFVPIFVPLLGHFDINPLFFGILVAINLQTAFLSPPVAMAAFYLKAVAPPEIKLGQIFLGMLPFLLIQLSALVIIYIFPEIVFFLPQQLYD